MPPGFPNMAFLESPRSFCENNLPTLKASILIQAIDGEDGDPTGNMMNIPMLYNTGAQARTISEELPSPRFQQFLTSQTPQQPQLAQVTANIRFTNTAISLNLIAIVRPKEAMPNHFNGVTLGQKGAIDLLVTEMVPRNFLPHLSGGFGVKFVSLASTI